MILFSGLAVLSPSSFTAAHRMSARFAVGFRAPAMFCLVSGIAANATSRRLELPLSAGSDHRRAAHLLVDTGATSGGPGVSRDGAIVGRRGAIPLRTAERIREDSASCPETFSVEAWLPATADRDRTTEDCVRRRVIAAGWTPDS